MKLSRTQPREMHANTSKKIFRKLNKRRLRTYPHPEYGVPRSESAEIMEHFRYAWDQPKSSPRRGASAAPELAYPIKSPIDFPISIHFSAVSLDWTLNRSPLLIWGGFFIPWPWNGNRAIHTRVFLICSHPEKEMTRIPFPLVPIVEHQRSDRERCHLVTDFVYLFTFVFIYYIFRMTSFSPKWASKSHQMGETKDSF